MQRPVSNRMPVTVASTANQRRIARRPAHSFNLVTRPYGIYPFMLAPVLPGETLENILLQARVVTDPVISRLTGWICEAYAAAHPWVLILEDQRAIGPANDAAHYHRCLTALAELP